MGMFLPPDATFRRLAWGDFVRVNRPPPPPGTTQEAAHTEVLKRLQPSTFHFDRSNFLKGGVFTLREDTNVLVVLDSTRTFVESWVFQRPQQFQDDLLNHEQGHYEIAMLNAKDFFFALLSIKGSSFASAQAGAAAISNLHATLFSAQAIHDKYDVDTTRSGPLNPANQAAWDAALIAARVTFTAPSLRVALKTAGLFP